MSAERIQLRGHCQCCGRQQAVIRGLMSKHGYEVKERGNYGWFQGICQGERFKPIEVDRAQADAIVKAVREECASLRVRAEALRSGEVKPAKAKSGKKVEQAGVPRWKWEDEMVPFSEAPAHYQREAVESAAWNAQRRSEIGGSFANGLEKLADEYHGKPLLEVKAEAGPAPIEPGERRVAQRGVLIAGEVYRGMVHWKDERGFKSKMSTRSWRALPMAA